MPKVRRNPEIARRMVKAAEAFLSSLTSGQRASATARFDVADHQDWTYLPGPRPGLALAEMSDEQRTLALELLDTGFGPQSTRIGRDIMTLDTIIGLRPGLYWVRILGTPGGDEPWAWRVSGHHLAIHVTIAGDSIAVTPRFLGAEPAVVRHAPLEGLRVLRDEEEVARELLGSLDAAQLQTAVVAPIAPDDILTRADPVADPGVLAPGLAYAKLNDSQRGLLGRLVRVYFDHAPLEVAVASWQDAVDAGLDEVTFRWAGPAERGSGHYYAVSGPTFLLEYDNTQDDANHIHSVWRDLRHDWGRDFLAEHYATH
ncbi:DUF3500 domain-containing protein [Actinopolymorpha alba]|uniref:DUF3500 domain-containing protein n=1 Tax=Actinopolymorpha alba TaxID=533267 RepID=UPI000367EC0A|nr:DUF3500 domain-containing protein [Actinopolymorpha alba]